MSEEMPKRIAVESYTADVVPLEGQMPTTAAGWTTPTDEYIRADIYGETVAEVNRLRYLLRGYYDIVMDAEGCDLTYQADSGKHDLVRALQAEFEPWWAERPENPKNYKREGSAA